ncbi:MAG: hypothetical protein R2744_05660 [Bacteroidales bacterium]
MEICHKEYPRWSYLMQVAFIGYSTFYRNIDIPAADNGNLGYIPLSLKTNSLTRRGYCHRRKDTHVDQAGYH